MENKEKQLLLRDLCPRLPYGVKCVSGVDDAVLIIEGINPNCCGASEIQVTYERSGINFDTKLSVIKPYLFPMPSMTEEQKKEWLYTLSSDYHITYDTIDWLNKNHFDYHGLIEKGLAIDATGLDIY